MKRILNCFIVGLVCVWNSMASYDTLRFIANEPVEFTDTLKLAEVSGKIGLVDSISFKTPTRYTDVVTNVGYGVNVVSIEDTIVASGYVVTEYWSGVKAFKDTIHYVHLYSNIVGAIHFTLDGKQIDTVRAGSTVLVDVWLNDVLNVDSVKFEGIDSLGTFVYPVTDYEYLADKYGKYDIKATVFNRGGYKRSVTRTLYIYPVAEITKMEGVSEQNGFRDYKEQAVNAGEKEAVMSFWGYKGDDITLKLYTNNDTITKYGGSPIVMKWYVPEWTDYDNYSGESWLSLYSEQDTGQYILKVYDGIDTLTAIWQLHYQEWRVTNEVVKGVQVYRTSDGIRLSEQSAVVVYSLYGKTVFNGYADKVALKRGAYFVVVNGRTYKVVQ